MNFIQKDIIVDKTVVAKVFKYTSQKFKGIKFFTSSDLNFQVGLMVPFCTSSDAIPIRHLNQLIA